MLATASCQKQGDEGQRKRRDCKRQQVAKNKAMKSNEKKRM